MAINWTPTELNDLANEPQFLNELNLNFSEIADLLLRVLSRFDDGPNTWEFDQDANGFDINNLGTINVDKVVASVVDTDELLVDGYPVPSLKDIQKLYQLAKQEFQKVTYVDTLEDMRALRGVVNGQAVQITTTGRAGLFRWDSSDLKAECDSDPQMGIYVPPTGQDGSAGAWVRVFDGAVNVLWFGADPTGASSSQSAFEGALSASRHITGPQGTYLFSNTIIVGLGGYIEFPGSEDTIFQLDPSFPSADKTPLFALSPNYDNPDFNAWDVDRVRLSGFTIWGNSTIDSEGMPNQPSGPGGVDVTWTKDDIVLEDVYFRRLSHGCFKRDSTATEVVHWGIRIKGGGLFQVYSGYELFPSLGTLDDLDIQRPVKGITLESNASSSTVWIKGLRAEVNTSSSVPAESYLVKTTSKCSISGYFEGSARHVVIGGGGLSTTTLLNCQFSRVWQDGQQGVPGTNVLYSPENAGASLSLIGTWGASSSNDAFIEFTPGARGTISWTGQGGNTGNIFKLSSGAKQPYPPPNISYFNPDHIRGYANTPNMRVYGPPVEWSGSGFGFYTRRYTRRVRSNVVGSHALATISGHCVGIVRAVMAENNSGSATNIMHRVIEFAYVDQGTTLVSSTDVVNVEGGLSPNIYFDGADLMIEIRNSSLDVVGLFMEVTAVDDPNDIITWQTLPVA